MRDGPYFRWRRASEVPGLTPVQKGVLLAITLHSDKNRRCFPKVETLAEYASCSERAARDAVRHLADAGLIALSRRDGHATTYTILLDSWPQRAVKEGVQPLQGCSDCTPDEIAGVQPLQGRGAAIAGVGVQPLHPTPAAIAPEDAIEETNLKKPIEEAKGESPQVIHGTQATVVLSEPPAEEGPLLELLASSGLTIGQAFTVARKLLEAGIHSPTDEAAAVYDEFSLGNLVGNQHKGKVIPAFRRAGWLPPKERRQATPPPQKAGGLEKAARIWQLADDDNLEESREAR